jgi:thiol-disulfide isomerase/thioredoxin
MRRFLAALAIFVSIPAAAVEAGSPAPALSLVPLEGGAPVAIAGLKGSVVYVDFWASWCPPCTRSMPVLDDLYKRNKSRGFVVVGINKDASLAEAHKLLAKVPVTFVLVQDGGDAAAKAFDVKGMPSGYLVDRKGVVRYVHRGFNGDHAAALEKEIDSLLKEPS